MNFLTLNAKKYTSIAQLYAGPDRDIETDKEVIKQP